MKVSGEIPVVVKNGRKSIERLKLELRRLGYRKSDYTERFCYID